jgi:hypothetical protein
MFFSDLTKQYSNSMQQGSAAGIEAFNQILTLRLVGRPLQGVDVLDH